QTTTPKILPDATSAKTRKKVASVATVVALCVGLSVLAVLPFFFMGKADEDPVRWHLRWPDTHDMFLHLDQMKSFYKGLQAKEVYPRWEIETNRGFGAPTTSFYPPGVYYLTALFYFFLHNWFYTVIWSQLAMMIASAAAMYLYARRNMSRGAALVAMGMYAIMPYHLMDEYHRGAIAELLSFVWMPLLLLFIEKAFELKANRSDDGPRAALGENDYNDSFVSLGEIHPPKHGFRTWLGDPASIILPVVGIAVCYGGFIWSHPPTAYQFSLVLAVAIPLIAIMGKSWRGAVKGFLSSGAGIALGLGLAAAYIYPAAAEKNLISNEWVATSWPYHQSYVFVRSDYYDDNPAFFVLVNQTWILCVALIVICGLAALLIGRRYRRSQASKEKIILWMIMGGFASFMMTTASYKVGSRIPMIDIGVFSWRLLGVTSLAGALLSGALTQSVLEAVRGSTRAAPKLLFGSILGLVIAGVIVFNLTAVFGPIYSENLFEPEAEHFNYAMLPKTAPDDPEDFPKDVPEAELDGDDGSVSVDVWQPEHRVIRADLPDFDELFVRTFNYPGWTATVDGNPATINTGEDYGDIEIDLDGGQHTVILDFLDTPVRKRAKRITLAASAFTVLLLAIGLLLRLKQQRRATTQA
ncbi:MAG TPA: hypothetical protein VI756_05350, partial [Blastocatellia bacterium]